MHEVAGKVTGLVATVQSSPLPVSQKPSTVGSVVSRKVGSEVAEEPTLPATSVAYTDQR